MKFFLLLSLILSAGVFADEADELGKEFDQYHKEAEKVIQQLQEKFGAVDTTKLSQTRGKLMELAADQRFVQSIYDLGKHPQRETLLIAELGFFVFMILMKAWRQSKAGHWFRKLVIGFFFSLVTWVGMLLVLPWFILGEPFRVVVTTFWRVIGPFS